MHRRPCQATLNTDSVATLKNSLLEHGIESPRGKAATLRRLEDAENELPIGGRALLRELGDEFRRLDEWVAMFDAQLAGMARQPPACRGRHWGHRVKPHAKAAGVVEVAPGEPK